MQCPMNQAACAVFLIESTISGVRKEKIARIRSVEDVAVFLHPLEATYTEEQKNQVAKERKILTHGVVRMLKKIKSDYLSEEEQEILNPPEAQASSSIMTLMCYSLKLDKSPSLQCFLSFF